jgi:hypothetical protein
MQVFSIFEHSSSLELALTKLELEGVGRENLFVVPINESGENLRIFDSLHDADGFSFLDKSMAMAVAFGVVGTSIGFNLKWGPIIWGLIAAFVGFLWDLLIIKYKQNGKRSERKILPLVILIVQCKRREVNTIEFILKENNAIGINTPGCKRDKLL